MSEVYLKIYRGYANLNSVEVFGHVIKNKNLESNSFEHNRWKYAFYMIRMFMIKPLEDIEVNFNFNGVQSSTTTMSDGFYHFSVPLHKPLSPGWHRFEVSVNWGDEKITRTEEFFMSFPGEYGFISDIDDTFLISHSSNFFKKLFVLLTNNIHRRKIFEDVVEHYRLLSKASRIHDEGSNLFFYVSSSEWNLYSFIDKFTALHGFPKAIIKLKKIKKGLGDFLLTGRGNHDHKFEKIATILNFYPGVSFTLLGDDSQKDPFIYQKIVQEFPDRIKAIYIRQTKIEKRQEAVKILSEIKKFNVACCYFKDSLEAIRHSEKIGLLEFS
ncbi:MAG: hypothetical protein CL613_06995 [Aquimarina sp.]|nr:hypothetical protein [Aquimarina sp.]